MTASSLGIPISEPHGRRSPSCRRPMQCRCAGTVPRPRDYRAVKPLRCCGPRCCRDNGRVRERPSAAAAADGSARPARRRLAGRLLARLSPGRPVLLRAAARTMSPLSSSHPRPARRGTGPRAERPRPRLPAASASTPRSAARNQVGRTAHEGGLVCAPLPLVRQLHHGVDTPDGDIAKRLRGP